jgi:hypothetical protein
MNSLRDQFSAVRKAQFDAQFDFFSSMTTQALESAGRVAALNMAMSRDAVQRSLGTTYALMNSRDPRDVLSLGGQAEEQMRTLFSYGRELLGIASGMRPVALPPQMPMLAQAAERVVEQVSEHVKEQAVETMDLASRGVAEAAAQTASTVAAQALPVAEAPHPVAAFAPVTEPVVVAEPAAAPEPETPLAMAEPVPAAEPTDIAKAAGKGAAQAAAIQHPAGAPVPAVGAAQLPKVAMPAGSSRRKK